MKLYSLKGRLIKKNVDKYRIDWDKKSRSNIQFKVKSFLKPYWFGHSVFEEFPVFGTKLKVDIINFTRKIAIEVHGNQHFAFNSHFHKTGENWLNSIKRDDQKMEWLKFNNIKVIEILQDEVEEISEHFFLERFNLELP